MKFIYTCTYNTRILLTSKGRIDLKDFLSTTSIASAITAAERLLEEMGAIQSDRSFLQRIAQSLSKFQTISNKICSLIPYPKHCDSYLVWCVLGRMLTLCKTIIIARPRLHQTIVVTRHQAIHQRNFAGSRTLPSLYSIICYYTLRY